MRIGLYGGTFDPIHVGHLLCAEWIRNELILDKVLFIPAKIPPHKQDQNITEAAHRCHMIEVSIANNPYFELSTIEIQATESISYTWLTVQKIKQLYPDSTLHLLLGADTIYDLPNWKDVDKIIEHCKLIGFERGGETSLYKEKDIVYKNEIYFVDTPHLTISSTNIRNRVAEGQSTKYMVTDSVLQYIKENHLYGYMEKVDERGKMGPVTK